MQLFPPSVIPRLKLDIGLSDLLVGCVGLALPGDRGRVRTQLEARWAANGTAFACLCVRSGLDLLLEALALPKGSEVLVSAITIHDMAHVIEEHGLHVVPVDVDYNNLEPEMSELERLVTERTRILLIAHLFGGRVDLSKYAAFAQQHSLLLVEDAAQAYLGAGDIGDQRAFATLVSFGPIKTATALGGALLTVRDPQVAERMRQHEAEWPLQKRTAFLDRLLRYGALRVLSIPAVFGLLIWLITRLGRDYDEALNSSTRSFPKNELFVQIRHQACLGQLRLLARRLRCYDGALVRERARIGSELLARLDPRAVGVPGREIKGHTFWVFPVNATDPAQLVANLLRAGFDATPGASSMAVMHATDGRDLPCPGARRALSNVVYLPVQPGLNAEQIRCLGDAVNACVQRY